MSESKVALVVGAGDATDTQFIAEMFPEVYAKKDQDGILDPEHVAEANLMLHNQQRSAWTFGMDLRPWMETW